MSFPSPQLRPMDGPTLLMDAGPRIGRVFSRASSGIYSDTTRIWGKHSGFPNQGPVSIPILLITLDNVSLFLDRGKLCTDFCDLING